MAKKKLLSANNDIYHGTRLADIVLGLAGDDQIYGRGANDSLDGGDGNDKLFGGDGNDVLKGSVGDDTLVGGVGNDDLDGGKGRDVLGGGDGNDTMVAGGGNDMLDGDVGRDALNGDNGNDTLIGGAGNDRLAGGSGNDTLDYSNDALRGATHGIVLDFSIIATGANAGWSVATDGFGNTDYFKDVERVIATAFADIITGDDIGRSLNGAEGDDTLAGGSANDTVIGGEGNDILSGGDGSDKLVGGNGSDTLDFSKDSLHGATAGIVLDFAIIIAGEKAGWSSATDGFGNVDYFKSIEGAIGTKFADIMTGDDVGRSLDGMGGNDTLASGSGTDTLTGGTGNDTLIGGAGDDRLVGGSGSDTLDYSKDASHGATSGIVLDFTVISVAENAGWSAATDGFGSIDYFKEVERVVGTEFADVMTGGALGISLDGKGGNDTLTGSIGDDTLIGGGGSDRFIGGDGVDTLDFRYDVLTGGNSGISLTFDDNAQWSATTDGFGNTDYFKDIERVIGTNFNDTIVCSALSKSYSGLDGVDSITGAIGLLNDTVDFRGNLAEEGVIANLSTGVVTNDGFGNAEHYSYIENIYGSRFNDDLTPGGSYSTADGGAGDDILRSSTKYQQHFTGGSGADTFVFTLATTTSNSVAPHEIFDFSRAEGDVIRMKGFGTMVFVNSSNFSGGQAECWLYVNQFTTDLIMDADADGVADHRISIWKFGLDSSDFNFV
jgi:Ca2+-binding RTX toxin-like protein